jgi:hypothetical protein
MKILVGVFHPVQLAPVLQILVGPVSATVKHAGLPKNIVILQKICVPHCQIRLVNIQMAKIKIQVGVYAAI